MRRLTRILALLVWLMASAVCLPLSALADTTLKMVTWLPSQAGPYRLLQAWADEVHKASGGTLTIAIAPKPTSRPTQQYELVKTGEADLAWHIPTYNAKQFPMLLAAELPFLSADAVTDSQALWEWYTTHIGDKEYGAAKVLTLWLPGPAQLHSTREIKTIDDLKGMKIRVPGGLGAAMAKAIGCVPVSQPMTKLANMLQEGAIEGSLTGWRPVKRYGLESVLKYHLEAPEGALYTTPLALLINRDQFNRLSLEHQAVLEKLSGAHAAAFLSKRSEVGRLKVRQEVEAVPGQVTHVIGAELARWQKQLAPLEAQWVNMANAKGYDGAALLKALKDTIKKYAANRS
ncbi:TRAP transporter substrate-binding protein [Candidatus Entotheonella palauensis]|uniref:C4-dicarboxylate ABC transporter substrate-binding protein n=1 Tax=Candidatus Entotheonella gemina TaxID=1429439 RepID=W4MDC2_9BACT|nr:TRAP transporter substrate-binding protein [Candidatus Entotheonella palauensis]ETX08203.1 MAG: hypothetical protein ETSY2_06765 [Candidatus Entotheonella gemina]